MDVELRGHSLHVDTEAVAHMWAEPLKPQQSAHYSPEHVFIKCLFLDPLQCICELETLPPLPQPPCATSPQRTTSAAAAAPSSAEQALLKWRKARRRANEPVP